MEASTQRKEAYNREEVAHASLPVIIVIGKSGDAGSYVAADKENAVALALRR